MKRIFQTPETALPLALALVLLAAVGFLASGLAADSPSAEGGPWLLAVLVLAGIVLSMFRPRVSISLGAAVLAPVVFYFGPLVAGVLAGCIRAAQTVARRMLGDGSAKARLSFGWKLRLEDLLTSVMTVALAGLAASTLWFARFEGSDSPSRLGSALWWAVAAGLLQATLVEVLGRLAAWLRSADRALVGRPDPRLLLDVAGWAIGGTLAAVFATAGTAVGLVVAAVVTLLAIELVRHRRELVRRHGQVQTLSQMSTVGRRMGALGGTRLELERVVEQILTESGSLVRSPWLQLEIVDSALERSSWHLGPNGTIEQGEPQPPEAPPVIPGLHRRVAWQVLERDLEAGERTIATLRMWTDPRQSQPETIELLDSFLPQLAAPLAAVLAEQKAGRDDLTGVATRAILEAQLESAYERCCLDGASMAVVMCDVDRFKSINDQFGHSVGDLALQQVATTLARGCRGRDTVCRYGGEEFVVLMDGANAEASVAVAERLRKAVEDIRLDADGTAILLTASFGVASFPDTYVGSGAELVPLADAALYEAKRRGRNRTLLGLGQGRFENARGRRLKGDTKSEAIEAPRLFV